MKHALIIGHPSGESFTHSMARAYADAARAHGAEIVARDLYREDFDPRLHEKEIPRPDGFAPAPDVEGERALVSDADIFAFFYPLWFNAPPAIVLGYIQRVFGMGFGYGPVHEGGNQPLLTGKRMISFSSSGAPKMWLDQEGGWAALKTLDAHIASVCGLKVVDHLHFGGVSPAIRPDVIERNLQAVRTAAAAKD